MNPPAFTSALRSRSTNGVVGSEAEAVEQLETGFAIGLTIINGRVSSIAETEHAGLIYNLTS